MLSTGIDIVQVERIEKILKTRKDRLYNKIFSQKEIDYIHKRLNSPHTVAGLFACKEAVSKALGTGIGEVAWKDIEIIHDEKGKPRINISDKVGKILKEKGLNSIEISISHEREYAVALAICYVNPKVGD